MRTVKVVRIEHKLLKDNVNGQSVYQGVYKGDKQVKGSAWKLIRRLDPPGKWFTETGKYIFAFVSSQKMMDWFTPDIMEDIRSLGYVIAVYEVPIDKVEFDQYGTQCAFCPASAVKVHRKRWQGERTLSKLAA